MQIAVLRRRMPFIVFVLLALLCLALIGVACACATGHPGQAADRAVAAIQAAPPLVEVWTLLVLVLIAGLLEFSPRPGRLSPVALQRLTL
jgi:hypothetical protein